MLQLPIADLPRSLLIPICQVVRWLQSWLLIITIVVLLFLASERVKSRGNVTSTAQNSTCNWKHVPFWKIIVKSLWAIRTIALSMFLYSILQHEITILIYLLFQSLQFYPRLNFSQQKSTGNYSIHLSFNYYSSIAPIYLFYRLIDLSVQMSLSPWTVSMAEVVLYIVKSFSHTYI
jgi:hypothetical protein